MTADDATPEDVNADRTIRVTTSQLMRAFWDYIGIIEDEGRRLIITRYGSPRLVIMTHDDYVTLEGTTDGG